jgi:hypothetical protein
MAEREGDRKLSSQEEEGDAETWPASEDEEDEEEEEEEERE